MMIFWAGHDGWRPRSSIIAPKLLDESNYWGDCTREFLRVGEPSSWPMEPQETVASSQNQQPTKHWIHLKDPKEFSRILYPNPVCFLCTPSNDDQRFKSDQAAADAHSFSHGNVMTISWLTATNNTGRFVMSLNKSRHSAQYMQHSQREFCLCVPVTGMESLVLAVGGTSGKFGSKFYRIDTQECVNPVDEDMARSFEDKQRQNGTKGQLSKRQRKRILLEERKKRGIPGLFPIPLGRQEDPAHHNDESSAQKLFYIEGTAARLRCRSYMVQSHGEVDDDHHLIFAEVLEAYCDPLYWDRSKKRFCPQNTSVKPFLTFLGAQTFGYVRNESDA